jgi:hypothetical protein
MTKFVVALGLALLVGCSSAPKTTSAPYCHTSQTIVTENRESVNSKTVVECTDDTVKRMTQVTMGISADCGEYTYMMPLQNRMVERRGYACKKYDGTWEILPHPSSFR